MTDIQKRPQRYRADGKSAVPSTAQIRAEELRREDNQSDENPSKFLDMRFGRGLNDGANEHADGESLQPRFTTANIHAIPGNLSSNDGRIVERSDSILPVRPHPRVSNSIRSSSKPLSDDLMPEPDRKPSPKYGDGEPEPDFEVITRPSTIGDLADSDSDSSAIVEVTPEDVHSDADLPRTLAAKTASVEDSDSDWELM